jgi:hypothetical protein
MDIHPVRSFACTSRSKNMDQANISPHGTFLCLDENIVSNYNYRKTGLYPPPRTRSCSGNLGDSEPRHCELVQLFVKALVNFFLEMFRFLVRKKGQEEYELEEGAAATQGVPTAPPAPNYGSIASLLNNEVRSSMSWRRGQRIPTGSPPPLLPPTMATSPRCSTMR